MFKTKKEFMENLEKELAWCGVVDKSEITADFELHFADSLAQGLTEAEICEKLGDIAEIAKQYAEGEIYPAVLVEKPQESDNSEAKSGGWNNRASSDYENSGIKIFGSKKEQHTPPPQTAPPPSTTYTPPPPPNYNSSCNSNNNINAGGLIAVICVDVFVFSWAIPALFSLIIGLLSVPFALVVSGVVMTFGGMFGGLFANFASPFTGLATVFMGIMLTALGGLFVLLGVLLVKLFVKIIRGIINWHGMMIVGKPVFPPKETKNNPRYEEVNA